MKQVVLEGPHRIAAHSVEEPVAEEGQVLLAPSFVGICGSDIHAYHGLHPFVTLPIKPGHEFSATVTGGPEAGARVTVEPNLVCGVCRNCRAGRYNICDDLKVIGFQATGAMADFVAVPSPKLVPLPDTMTTEDACLIEPLAVGLHAVQRASLRPGETVLVLGAGTIGLMCLQAAKALGAGRVAVTDMQAWRLELAEQLGADAVLRADDPNLRAAVRAALGPDAPDVVLECAGHGPAMQAAIAVSRKGGRVVVVGVHGEPVDLNVGLVQDWELDVLGALMYTRQDFLDAIRVFGEGRAATAPFVTHRFPLEDVARAYETVANPAARALKVLVQVAGR